MKSVPPDDDKRYFYDGAAYAMAWGPRSSGNGRAPRTPEQEAKHKAKKARYKARRAAREAEERLENSIPLVPPHR